MVVPSSLLQSALLPALALGSSVAVRGSKDKDTFDAKSISLREVGARNTLDWRIWLEKDGDPISPWHDIPLYPNKKDKQTIHIYVEIPRWSDSKIETKRSEPLNPTFHDDKNDKPRFVYSVWPHKSYPFHYGSIPQTWESPNFKHELTGFIGDNDPVDVFDISEKPSYTGQIKQVKILGGLAMIDDNTTDWKVITIDVTDPLAKLVNDVDDLEKYRPGLAKSFHEWFIYYKAVKGDGLNTITGDKYQNASFVTNVVSDSHGYWEDLVRGKVDSNEINYNQTSNKDFKNSYVSSKKATKTFDIPKKPKMLPAAERPTEYDLWYYLDADFNVIEL